MPQTYFEEYAHPSWIQALKSYVPLIKSIEKTIHSKARSGIHILPPANQTYRALSRPLEETQVLLLGQDPYPTPGHAVGLAFSTSVSTSPLPRSLTNIYKELHDDMGVVPALTGDLSVWMRQGIMLLNTALSVEAGHSGSHRQLWEEFTTGIITTLAHRNQPLVSILWGRDAQKFKTTLGNHPYITSAHPSPLSAGRGFFGSRPFSRCNELLQQQGGDPIDWKLTPAPVDTK